VITEKLLQQIDSRAAQRPVFAAALDLACTEFGILVPLERAAFLAQVSVESSGFLRTEENLHYSSAARLRLIFPRAFPTEKSAAGYVGQPARIASFVYANKIGNGDIGSGDGWRYRGRGLIQITGKANYAECMNDLYGEADVSPDRLLEPDGASRSAAWFWWRNRCGEVLGSKGFDAVTRVINGPGMAGADERRAAFERAKRAMGV
jgi:putative chitinase